MPKPRFIRPTRLGSRYVPKARPSFHPIFPTRHQLWLDPVHNRTVKVLVVVDGFVIFRDGDQDPVSLHLADFLDQYQRKH